MTTHDIGKHLPEMDGGEAQANEEGDEGGVDLHVLAVCHGADDEEEEGRAQHLVHGQRHRGDLNILSKKHGHIVVQKGWLKYVRVCHFTSYKTVFF